MPEEAPSQTTSMSTGTAPAPAATENAQEGLQDALGGSSDQGDNKGEQSPTPPKEDSKGADGDEPQKDEPKKDDEKSEDEKDGQDDKKDAKNDQADKDPTDQPIKDWSKVKIELPKEMPEGVSIDQPTLDAFGKEAVKLGLTPKQAQSLVSFQIDAVAKQREAFLDAGIKQLRKDWGSKAEENQKAVLTLVANIDREMGGKNEFSKALNACGATCYPGVCKGLLKLANAISEDSIGRGSAAGDSSQQETAYEALKAEWEKAQHIR